MPYESRKMTHVDGKMHHLGVDETQVAKRVVVTPDPQSIEKLAVLLDDAKFEGDYREYITYTGTYNGVPVSIMSCGFGCMPMAIAVEELNHLHVEKIIKVDTCATICEDVTLGDIKCAKGAVRGDGVTKEYIDLCYPAFPDMKLMFQLQNKCENKTEPCYFRSHDCLNHESPYAPKGMERIQKWKDLGVEMMDGETSALYVIGNILKVSVASAAIVSENYITGEEMTGAEKEAALLKVCKTALEAITA